MQLFFTNHKYSIVLPHENFNNGVCLICHRIALSVWDVAYNTRGRSLEN